MSVPKLNRAEVEALWDQHSTDLRHLVRGVLRDADLADEALQQTFVTALERGHTARQETQRGWLFRVAYHHAIELKRAAATKRRNLDTFDQLVRARTSHAPSAAEAAAEIETRAATRTAIDALPTEQRQIVELRLRGQLTFRQISAELGIPLSTALTRMRLALTKLRNALER